MIKLEANSVVIVRSSTLRDIIKRNVYDHQSKIDIGQGAIVIEYPDGLFHANQPEAFKSFIIESIKEIRNA